MKPLLSLLVMLGFTACGQHRVARNPSGAEAAAAEIARQRDPLGEKQENRDTVAIDRRAADYERQGRTAEEARTLAEVEYARSPK